MMGNGKMTAKMAMVFIPMPVITKFFFLICKCQMKNMKANGWEDKSMEQEYIHMLMEINIKGNEFMEKNKELVLYYT